MMAMAIIIIIIIIIIINGARELVLCGFNDIS